MTIEQALVRGSRRLNKTSDSPRLDSEVLLAYCLKIDRAELLRSAARTLKTSQQHRFNRLLTKREVGWPIAYLRGFQEFGHMMLRVTPAVLIPRPFTETLVDAILSYIPPQTTIVIADIGTGSGAIALSIAQQRLAAQLIATDISPAALRIAKLNARRLGLSRRIRFHRGSGWEPLQRLHQPEIVVANLPYLTPAQVRHPSLRHEPRLALDGGRGGRVILDSFLRGLAAQPRLQVLALELDPSQVPHVRQLLGRDRSIKKIHSISDGHRVRGLVIEIQRTGA